MPPLRGRVVFRKSLTTTQWSQPAPADDDDPVTDERTGRRPCIGLATREC